MKREQQAHEPGKSHYQIASPGATARRRYNTRRRVRAGSIMLILFLAYCYFIPRGAMWNADTRIFLAASIVDRGQLNIDPYAQYTGDKAAYNGHYYSDKAPGSSLLAVPAYLFVKLTLYQGKQTYEQLLNVSEAKRTDFLARYLLTLLLVGIPSACLGGLLFHFLAYLGLGARGRFVLVLGYGLGTIAFAFSTVFFSHQITALLLFGAFYLLFCLKRQTISPWNYLSAGLLAGYAVATEYPSVLLVGCLVFYAFWPPKRKRPLLLFVSGLLPSLCIVAIYNTLCFGSPLSQGYAHLAGPEAFRAGQSQGLMGVTSPHLEALWQTTFGLYRGLFLLSPFLLLAIPGFWLLFHQRAWRGEAILWLGMVLLYFIFTISYFAWDGGYSLGPRHFIPALPFLTIPVACVLNSRGWGRNIALGLIAFSITVVTLSTAVYPLNDPRFDSPLTQRVLPLLLGIQPKADHPGVSPATLWSAFWQDPLLTHARLDNNWGELFRLPGIWQLLPLCIGISLILGRFWHSTAQRSRSMQDAAALWITAQPGSDAPSATSEPASAGDRPSKSRPASGPLMNEHADPSLSPQLAHPESPEQNRSSPPASAP